MQRDLFDCAGDVAVDITHDVSHLEWLEQQDHHAAHDAAERLLRRETGYHSDNTAGRQQSMYRARKQRYRSDNDHAAGKIHRSDRDIAHKAGYCRERTARLFLSVDELAHQSIYRLRCDIGQHCGQDRQSGHAQKATGGRGQEFFYLCKQAQHSFP